MAFKNQKLRTKDLCYFLEKYEHSWVYFGLGKRKRNEKKIVRAILKRQRPRWGHVKKECSKKRKRWTIKNNERANYLRWEKIEIFAWNGKYFHVPCLLGDSHIFGGLLIQHRTDVPF